MDKYLLGETIQQARVKKESPRNSWRRFWKFPKFIWPISKAAGATPRSRCCSR